MKIYKLSAIFLFLLLGVLHSNPAFSAVNCSQFASEINLKAFPGSSLCHFSRSTTEHKCYSKEVKNRNITCYLYTDNWSCKAGYRKSGERCVRSSAIIKIPQNSHKVGNGWTCNMNYYRDNSKISCLRVPVNSSSSRNSNYFTCNTGYDKSGNRCVKKKTTLKIPKNAHASGAGWICDYNYYRVNSKTSCLRVPVNSSSSSNSNYFTCNTGYDTSGNRCVKKKTTLKIPKNAHASGAGWICDYNYYKKGSKCQSVPLNGFSNNNSNNWYCSNGYEKIENSCVKEAKFSKNLIFLGIVIFLVLFLNRKSKAPTGSNSRPKPKLYQYLKLSLNLGRVGEESKTHAL